MTALPIRYAPPVKCHRDLERGEVKRIVVGTLLVGCYVGCPACGVVAQVTDGLAEEGLVAERGVWKGLSQTFSRPTNLRSVGAFTCRGCGCAISLCGETVEALP